MFLLCFVAGLAGLVVILAVATLVIRTYNSLVAWDEIAVNSFSKIEVQLKRRYDLIPNLVEAASGYLSHERETLEAVIEARNQASSKLSGVNKNLGNHGAMQTFAGAEVALTGALGRLAMVIEDYPDLKANTSIASLTEELTSTENRISFAREVYNDTATKFNVARRIFPTVVFASAIGFERELSMLEFADREEIQHAPRVSLTADVAGV